MQSWHGRLESRTNPRESAHLSYVLEQFRRQERILRHIHTIPGPLVDVINFTRTSIIQPKMQLSAAELGRFDGRVLWLWGHFVNRGLSHRDPADRRARFRNQFCVARGKYLTMLGTATMRLTPAGPTSYGEYNNLAIRFDLVDLVLHS